jgi:hypothetical protein
MGLLIPDVGADTSKDDLLELGINQWLLESSALLDTDTNLYRHINDFDPYAWATGNGWMLHGGMRVLASIAQAGRNDAFAGQIADVKDVMGPVFTALFAQLNVSIVALSQTPLTHSHKICCPTTACAMIRMERPLERLSLLLRIIDTSTCSPLPLPLPERSMASLLRLIQTGGSDKWSTLWAHGSLMARKAQKDRVSSA